jgi:Tol biopolymer transport system component
MLVIPRETTVSLLAPGGVERTLATLGVGVDPAARFSRDGSSIFFAHQGLGTMPRGLYNIRVDGSQMERLGAPGDDGQEYMPAPSHDGLLLAYVSTRSPCHDACIRILDVQTNQDRTFAGREYLALGKNVAWAPTEDLIAYATDSQIRLVRSDGTGERVLASEMSGVTWMDWSPDGQWLLVSLDGPVTLLNVQTGERLPIGQLTHFGAASWRP